MLIDFVVASGISRPFSAARELCSRGAPRSRWRDLRSVPPSVYGVICRRKASFPPPNNLYPPGPVPLYLSAGGQTLGSELHGSASARP